MVTSIIIGPLSAPCRAAFKAAAGVRPSTDGEQR